MGRSSISWLRSATPSPRLLVLPPGAASLDEAHAAIELWEHYARKTLDETQRLAVEVMMAETSGGHWAARTSGREMPRQNGKGDELEVVELWGLMQRGEAILHTAHELTTVSSAHQRMVALIEGHPDLRRRRGNGKVLNGLGQQLIEVEATGGVIAYRTRTNGGGRGLDDISRLVIDEAQHAKPEQLASTTPILLVNPNPQTNFVGTGAIDGVSDWWWQLRRRALTPDSGMFGYVGHTAEDVSIDGDGQIVQSVVDPEDRSLWPLCNPALHYGRTSIEFFEEQLRNLGPALFAREHLGVWDPPPVSGSGLVVPSWDDLVDVDSLIVEGRSIALDVSPGYGWACFGGAGRRQDGRLHVEVTGGADGLDHRRGAGWVAERAAELSERWGLPIRVEAGSPASVLIPAMRQAGAVVEEVPPSGHVAGAGMLLAACEDDGLRHVGQAALTSAVKAAARSNAGDGAVKWARRSTKADISPLVAVTLALSGVAKPAAQEFFVY